MQNPNQVTFGEIHLERHITLHRLINPLKANLRLNYANYAQN